MHTLLCEEKHVDLLYAQKQKLLGQPEEEKSLVTEVLLHT